MGCEGATSPGIERRNEQGIVLLSNHGLRGLNMQQGVPRCDDTSHRICLVNVYFNDLASCVGICLAQADSANAVA